ncbi:hypothetical protein F7725_026973 [Dissostichus mawsoni]|uniref:HAT C-terminal dimerisation domain-containing protein n=1 Tax=Dissostichus mawsoni TaxID=36200 RepID=A0A7J5XA58_DISMA|nr:hypothetical protein F7725_026973 [Dissostichus mawsoni]
MANKKYTVWLNRSENQPGRPWGSLETGNCRALGKTLERLCIASRTYLPTSAECERGFSAVNNTDNQSRNRLREESLSLLLFVDLNGPPLNKFDPVPFQLKRDFLQRLLTRISQITQRLPLDVDYLQFAVDQEMALFRSLSGQVDMPQDVINALTELSRLVNIEDISNQTPHQVPVMQGEMGRPKYVVCPQQLQGLIEDLYQCRP